MGPQMGLEILCIHRATHGKSVPASEIQVSKDKVNMESEKSSSSFRIHVGTEIDGLTNLLNVTQKVY